MTALKRIKAITKREFLAYFNSALAYVFLVTFLVLGAVTTFKIADWFDQNEASLRLFFSFHPFLYLIFIPAVGMRVWSEEEKEGTLELLLTMPISVWHAVAGKFLAGWLFIGFALLLTFPMVITVYVMGEPDAGRLFSGYLGSFLAGGMCLSLTSLASAFTKNQVISFLFGFLILLLVIAVGMPQLGVADYLKGWVPQAFVETIVFFSISPHFEGLEKGVLDIRDIIYFASFIFFGLLCSTVILRFRKAAHKHNRLLSFTGILIFSVTLLLVNYMSRNLNKRYDMSADGLYTLTESTRVMVSRLDSPLTLRFYYSKSDSSQTIANKAFAQRVEDLLKEYISLSEGRISYKVLDPRPESVEEESAKLDGIEPTIKKDRTKSYFGVSASYRGMIRTIPKLTEEDAALLEYNLTNLIKSLVKPGRPVIGIITDYKIAEQKANPLAGVTKGQPEWKFLNALKQDYDVRSIDPKLTSWPLNNGKNAFDLVIIFNLGPLLGQTQFALNQYLLRGGKAILMTDAFPVHAHQASRNFQFVVRDNFLCCNNLLGITESWNIRYNDQAFLIDPAYETEIKQGVSKATLTLQGEALNRGVHAIRHLDKVIMPYSGYFTYKESDDISITPLFSSSKKASLLKLADFRKVPQLKEVKADEKAYPLALQVKGKLPSFYSGKWPPERIIKSQGLLKEPIAESEVFLFGDTDWLVDIYSYLPPSHPGAEAVRVSDNIDMLINIVDGMLNEGAMIDIRMRREKKRTLEYMGEIQQELMERFSDEIEELRKKHEEKEQRVADLHFKQENQISLTDEEAAELKNSEDEMQKLVDRKNAIQEKFNELNKRTQNKIVFYNTAAVPMAIIVFGLLVGWYRKRRLGHS